MEDRIKQLFGVNKIEVDKKEGKLYIEDAEGSGVKIDINGTDLMHLLNVYTEEEYTCKDIYGFEPFGEEWG